MSGYIRNTLKNRRAFCKRAAGGRTLSGVRFLQSSEKSGIIRRRTKKEQVERAKAMRDQAEKERTEVLERFQAVKGRLESEQSMIVGFLEKEGKTETDFDEKEAENALRKLTEDLKNSSLRSKMHRIIIRS